MIPVLATWPARALAPKAPPEPRLTLSSKRPCFVSSSVREFWKPSAGGAFFARVIDSVAV